MTTLTKGRLICGDAKHLTRGEILGDPEFLPGGREVAALN